MNDPLQALLNFITEIEQLNAPYRLSVARPDAVMVEVAVPGERWEIEFFATGEIEIERFRSTGQISGSDTLPELFKLLK